VVESGQWVWSPVCLRRTPESLPNDLLHKVTVPLAKIYGVRSPQQASPPLLVTTDAEQPHGTSPRIQAPPSLPSASYYNVSRAFGAPASYGHCRITRQRARRVNAAGCPVNTSNLACTMRNRCIAAMAQTEDLADLTCITPARSIRWIHADDGISVG
jgi:hypothetical protein